MPSVLLAQVIKMKRVRSLGNLAGLSSTMQAALLAILLAGALATTARAQQTSSQSSSEQLNQLFLFETTPNKSAAGEAYASAEFTLLGFPHEVKQYRYQLQGQYSITNQLAVGGFLPYLDNTFSGGSNDGFGDLTFYAQYKLDQFINADVVNLTAQLDLITPTGDINRNLDTGRFGVRPAILVYKSFGQVGPGDIGTYGTFGFTLTTHTDVRIGVAMTYQWQRLVGVMEFDDRAGDNFGEPLITFTPGIVYVGTAPWELAVGVPLGANNASPDWGVVVKLTYAFEK
jgi:hypothetical protein